MSRSNEPQPQEPEKITKGLSTRNAQKMSSIELNKPFTMPRDVLRGELDQLAAKLSEQLQLKCQWLSDDCLDFRRNGAEGQININDDKVELTIKLGMMMNMFRGTIEQEIQTFMEQRIY
jgi:putative polyhydroxyalkanoate system protein